MYIGLGTMEIKRDVPQKVKNKTTMWSIIPFFGMYPKEIKTGYQKDICTSMLIAVLFTIPKMQCKGLSTNEHLFIYLF